MNEGGNAFTLQLHSAIEGNFNEYIVPKKRSILNQIVSLICIGTGWTKLNQDN